MNNRKTTALHVVVLLPLVFPDGLSETDVAASGSLAGGGGLGNVDFIYIPEPSTMMLMLLGVAIGIRFVNWRRWASCEIQGAP